MILLMAGCQPIAGPPTVRDVVDIAAPTYAELAEAHNARIDRIQRMHSRGTIELRWRDERPPHNWRREQGDVDLYLELPLRTALRVEKLGTNYLWLGSNEHQWWLFDLSGDERILYTGGHASATIEVHGGGAALPVRPLVLLDLLGFSRLPAPLQGDNDTVTHDAALDAWVVDAPGQGGMMRIYFDRTSLLPRRIEGLSEAGEVAYYSEIYMNRYRSVPVAGPPPFPRVPGLVDIHAANGHEQPTGGAWAKLQLDSPTGHVPPEPFERVFDLDRLNHNLRPTRIESE